MLLNKSKNNTIQSIPIQLATHQVVSITDILDCREQRQSRQQQWLATHQSPLISLTLVIPGPIKDSITSRKIFNKAWQAIQLDLNERNWQPIAQEILLLPTGIEALIALSQPAEIIKHAMIVLEQQEQTSRLWDIDVVDEQGQILSRQNFNLPPRSCLVCNDDARVCARSQRHSLDELLSVIERLFNE